MSPLTDKLKELENTLIEKVNKIKTGLKNELIEVIENDKKMTNDDIKSIKESHTVMKRTIGEQQLFLERVRRENNSKNVLLTGIPKIIVIDDVETEDAAEKTEHIGKLIDINVTNEDHQILKTFEVKRYDDTVMRNIP